ncbi:Pycsar system effector family protein [Staphylococcus xylosus]|uniref:Pycsar system effector family protein n=1 Tax=Staphylococcus xylosus TaxID=1288 RepID=UPI001CDC983F|nr:Pycsar system effector family protein [Staphylococcus xylosus]MCQ3816725.1 hypothetical protein [Staphylococcus xylosus]MCQ3819221.1 hypothetical protein [Staphylococcus xylosus]UBV36648.1 hypothetical protein JGY88_09295 [Staphylococcus xylosus]
MEYNYAENLDRIKSWINNCDTKISFALTFEIFLLGFIFSNDTIQKLVEIKKGANVQTIVLLLSFLTALILLSLSLLTFYKALKANVQPDSESSVLYYGSISSQTFNSFRKEVNELTEYNLKQDYIAQIHTTAKICKKKFDNYNKGLKFLFISFIPLVIYFSFSIFI